MWAGDKSFITMKDDGCGMNSTEIINAMRPGAQNPLEERSSTDLGRFGLGLKTASFSQCRKLTVLSRKTDYKPSYWTWDLDYVAYSCKWELLKWIPDEFAKCLDDVEHGTLVIWSDLDRIIPRGTEESDANAHLKFSEALEIVRKHIAMTFHRFIEDKDVKIYWCGHEIEPWNPFCLDENKTQVKPTDLIRGGIKVKGFILPHKNNFSSEQAYKKAEGINGWPAQQGFYVYRNKRLLLDGNWLGLRRKEEHLKLVRIMIDIPNSKDMEWQIDIKKSKAYPPLSCIEQLKAYARDCCSEGEKVFRHRGKILKQKAGQEFQPLWLEKKKNDKWSYVINRNHQMICDIKSYANENPEKAIDALLRFIEEAVPTKTIYINEAKGEENQKTPFSDINVDLVRNMLLIMYKKQIDSGKTAEQAKCFLMTVEPFNNFEDLIDEL